MKQTFLPLLLLAVAAPSAVLAADPNVNPDAVAGNEQVRKIMETYGGRGTLADDTPPSTPQEALKKFTVRSDVAIDLMAAEPDVMQPLYASWDSQGRMWVTQYKQYQFPAGLKVVSYDQHLRAKFDKVPLPPPQGEKGADPESPEEWTYDRRVDIRLAE